MKFTLRNKFNYVLFLETTKISKCDSKLLDLKDQLRKGRQE